MTQVIWTVFAGRRGNLELQLKYTDILHARGLLHEVHYWNFTRSHEDDMWLRDTFDKEGRTERLYVKVFHPNKSRGWRDYYEHYRRDRYPEHVIIKCDDDVVFVDVDAFEGFIQRRLQNTQDICAFASIVNNGVVAHLQQKQGLIPASLGEFPYDTFCGKLWNEGYLATRLHYYFVQNKDAWLSMTREIEGQLYRHPIGDRISINFFAILSQDLPIYQEVGHDDEADISIHLPLRKNRHHYVDLGFTVAHLSFYRQIETGLNATHVREMYATIAPQ